METSQSSEVRIIGPSFVHLRSHYRLASLCLNCSSRSWAEMGPLFFQITTRRFLYSRNTHAFQIALQLLFLSFFLRYHDALRIFRNTLTRSLPHSLYFCPQHRCSAFDILFISTSIRILIGQFDHPTNVLGPQRRNTSVNPPLSTRMLEAFSLWRMPS